MAGLLGCNTDRRSAKVAHLAANPRVAWLFYDGESRLQVRATGTAVVQAAGPASDAAWERSTPDSRRCYLAPFAPGEPQPQPSINLPDAFRHRVPTREESEAGREHFAIIECRLETLDWLQLHHAGHLRARFMRQGDDWTGGWVAV